MSIPQPNNIVDGSFTFKWRPDFGSASSERLYKAQCFIDSECIRLMIPYTPRLNGILFQSPKFGTKIGSGHIVYDSPYARYQYYGNVYGPSFPIFKDNVLVGWRSPKGKAKHPTGAELQYSTHKHPNAGKLWFERMKADKRDAILEGAANIAGGKAE